ncbi:uncharacterized protein LOC144326338 [Podarcis muralis]
MRLNKQPRVQLPESGTSSGAEEEQQQLEEEPRTVAEDKPSGKRHEKKHICKKSKSRNDDTDEETGSSSKYDSDASLGSYWDASLPIASTWSSTVARTLSGAPVEPWRRKVIKGVLASVAPSTLRSYKKVWCDFMGFRSGISGLSPNVPPSTDDVLQYLSHLDDLGRASKTLKIHVAAISFFCKAMFSSDLCSDFLIRRAIEGWGRLQPPRAEGRKPVSYGLLSQIRIKLRSICWTKFEARLFSAAYAISFFGVFRVGEVVAEVTASGSTRGLLMENMQMSEASMTVRIRQSKTDQAGKGSLVKLTASVQQGPCPVKDTRQYLYLRPPGPGPLLVHEDGSRLMRHQFTRVLCKAIDACGLSSQDYAAHSFRIGAATTAAHLGLPADRIKEMSRWKSDAYKGYIHIFRKSVWICGHSIVHWAHVRSASCGLNPNLGLPSGMRVSWFSRRGMRWEELMPLLREKVAAFGPPDILILQLGENDLVSRRSADLLWNIKRDLDELAALCPGTTVFWSSFLKRIVWCGAQNTMAIEKSRKLLNRAVVRWVRFMNGRVISCDRIRIGDQALFRNDGVHLSDRGNDIWLGSIISSIRDWLQL